MTQTITKLQLGRPRLQLKAQLRFPSRVVVAAPLLLDTAGGNYLFSLDTASLQEASLGAVGIAIAAAVAAMLAGPTAFTGLTTAPTQAPWDSSTKLATTAYADGVLSFIRANAVNVKDAPFLAAGNGVQVAATCTISAGSPNLAAVGASFGTSVVGQTILVPGAGAAGAALLTTILSRTDATHVVLAANAGTALAAASTTLLYGTNDTTAITTALAMARSLGKPLEIPTGTYITTAKIDFAYFGAHVVALSPDVHLQYLGTGTGYSIDGGTFNPSAGIVRCVFGGQHPIHMLGHAGSGNLFYFNNVHWSDINIRVSNTAGQGVTGDNLVLGSPTGPGAAVCTKFRIVISPATDNLVFTATPTIGLSLNTCYASIFENLTIEGCGAGSNFAVSIINSNNNLGLGGTVESNACGGIFIGGSCHRNTFINMDCESNGALQNWLINGLNNRLIDCCGAATAGGGAQIGGTFNSIEGCEFDTSFVFAAGSSDNRLIGGSVSGTLTDSGARNTRWGVSGWNDNLIINGALNLNGTAISSVTGTGAVAVMSVAPALTNPTVTTQAVNDNSTKAASTAYADAIKTAMAAYTDALGLKVGVMIAKVSAVNFNAANTDTAIPIVLPAGFTRFSVFRVNIGHASQTLTTSTFGVFSTTGGGGFAIINGGTVNTLSSASDATLNNEQTIAGNAGTMVAASLPTPNTIYFRVGTAQGAAATADVVIYYLPAP